MTILTHCRSQLAKQNRVLHSVLHFTPRHRCQEQQNQACYLTKTIVKDELPPASVIIPTEERANILESIKRCIIETNFFHRDEECVPKKRLSATRKKARFEWFRSGLQKEVLLNMLRVIWSTQSARDLRRSTTLNYRSGVLAPWERFGEKIQVSGRTGHMISGKQLLPLFADADEVLATRDVDVTWDDVLSPFFDLHHIASKFELDRGFYEDSPFPCPQTLIMMNPEHWKSRFNTGQGVFFSFAHAMTYALSNGEEMGKDLKNPVPIQSIVFDGITLYYICYQLNTLNFDDENRGVKNIAWIQTDQRLYDDVTDKPSEYEDFIEYTSSRTSLVDFNRKKVTETFADPKTVRVSIGGYNTEAVDTFIDFMLRR